MICYRDRTFCIADCTRTDCDVRMTPEVQAGADRWWAGFPGPAPIATGDRSAHCEYHQPKEQPDG
ncbi:hypothetical protein [Sphingomonas sp. Leaf4]|uniref:hypothetical protein n=1 Tax=Sphingomonas sp. Leaf4 TaxID=2876553 RepID=UPI001E58479E|nr:hypothetical protein [Sphingomonas sp. Leaf4]